MSLFNKEPSITLPFPSEQFASAWEDWKQHRAEIRKPLKPTAIKYQLKKLAILGEARAIKAIEHSICQGWQGIYEPFQQQTYSTPQQDEWRKKEAALL